MKYFDIIFVLFLLTMGAFAFYLSIDTVNTTTSLVKIITSLQGDK